MIRTTARQRMFAAVAVTALLVLGACGADEGDQVASAGGEQDAANPAEDQDTAPLDENSQALEFAGCMRDNGVDMPDPAPGQEGLVAAFQAVAGDYDQATMEQAFLACQDLMPQYSQGQVHEEADILALAECLREQGLDVSDDPFQDMHSGAIDQTELAEAMEVCRNALTGGGQ